MPAADPFARGAPSTAASTPRSFFHAPAMQAVHNWHAKAPPRRARQCILVIRIRTRKQKSTACPQDRGYSSGFPSRATSVAGDLDDMPSPDAKVLSRSRLDDIDGPASRRTRSQAGTQPFMMRTRPRARCSRKTSKKNRRRKNKNFKHLYSHFHKRRKQRSTRSVLTMAGAA